ncbi:T9SS type B sorting domain-containing protein [Sinomicrobium sp.]
MKVGAFEILFFLLIITGGTSFAQTTTPVPDSAFEQQLVDLGIDSNGMNGNILNTDAEAVTELEINRTDITDFSGLEAFVNLEIFNAGTNQFPTLPLTTLTALRELHFDRNEVLASLDLSANSELTVLVAKANGMSNVSTIPTLDLSQNNKLEVLEVYNFENLENFILPNSNTLRDLYIYSDFDIDIDLSSYTNLESLYLGVGLSTINVTIPSQNILKHIRLFGGNMGSLDLSSCTLLETIDLIGTDVTTIQLPPSDQLTEVSISGHRINHPLSFVNCPALTDLEIRSNGGSTPLELNLSNNALLTRLSLDYNLMEQLDITHNPLLEELSANGNQLNNIDLSQNPELETLSLSSNQLTSIDITHNPKLEDVNLSSNEIAPTIDLSQNPLLTSFNAQDNQLASLDISANTELRHLNVSQNLITGNSVIRQFFDHQTTLSSQSLVVNDNRMSGKIPDFSSKVNQNTGYFRLVFHNNNFHFGDFEAQHSDYIYYRDNKSSPDDFDNIFREYSYAPQNKVNQVLTETADAGSSLTLTTTVRGSQNHYRWLKDGSPIPDAPDSATYTIENISECDAGVYRCEVTSDLVPLENSNPPGTDGKNLILTRRNITVNVEGVVKECTDIIAPADQETDVILNAEISWNEITGACGYRLSIGTNPQADNLLSNQDVKQHTTYTPEEPLEPNTTYYVRIVPYFADGDQSGCPITTFTTGTESGVPSCTTLITPAPGSTEVSVNSILEWEAIADADGYRLRVGSSAGNNDIATTDIVGSNNTSYTFDTPLPEHTEIFVSIIPYNAAGNAQNCGAVSFTTETLLIAPECTSINSPANEATEVSINAIISWNAQNNAEGYYLTIGTTPGGTEITYRQELTTTSFTPSMPWQEDTTYYVSVIPYNEAGEAQGCNEISFTTETLLTAPECTSINSPLNGATEVALNASISWNAQNTAEGYYLTIGTTPGGTEIANRQELTTTSFTPSMPWQEDTTYYVSVIPYNEAGEAQGCNEISFTTETLLTAPECTTINSPLNGATEVALNASIGWNVQNNAEGYYLTIGTTPGGTEIADRQSTTETSYTPAVFWDVNTTYYVTVVPYNVQGSASGCTELSFTTENPVPSCVSVSSPADGATGVSLDSGIHWNPTDNTDGYYLTIGSYPGGNDIIDRREMTTTSFFPASSWEENTTYYISVIPFNAAGMAERCGESSFTTRALADISKTSYGFSPNGDGIRDFWEIEGIEDYPDNTVSVFNRWGDMVFQIEEYDNRSNIFRGEANKLSSLGAGRLPEGTYFFTIQTRKDGQSGEVKGFLVLRR